MTQNKTKLLIIDDSALIRQTMSLMLKDNSFVEVVGTAFNPFSAVKKIEDLKPDVLLLDIQMPKMDGLTFLEKLMKQKPYRVIIFSAFVRDGSYNALKALELGAVSVIEKPKLTTTEKLKLYEHSLVKAIKTAAIAKVKIYSGISKIKDSEKTILTKPTLKYSISKKSLYDNFIIAIGASTGGTEAIRVILENLPDNLPPIVITQHMPVGFTNSFATRLNQLSKMKVKEAENNEILQNGHAYIARGDRHLVVSRQHTNYVVNLLDTPNVNRHKPSVDVLFYSVAKTFNKNAIGIILTGMGGDGAAGLKLLHDKGVHTIAQDEESCVVFGMPKVAIEKKAVDKIMHITDISHHIVSKLNKILK